MAETDRKEAARTYLRSLGYSEEEIQKLQSGPSRSAAETRAPEPSARPRQEGLPHGSITESRPQRRAPDGVPVRPRPQHGPGVRFRDVEYWLQAMQQPGLDADDRARYARLLKSAVAAADTPSVTPEDVAYWLHALDDPALSGELRAYYKRSLRRALREYDVSDEEGSHGG